MSNDPYNMFVTPKKDEITINNFNQHLNKIELLNNDYNEFVLKNIYITGIELEDKLISYRSSNGAFMSKLTKTQQATTQYVKEMYARKTESDKLLASRFAVLFALGYDCLPLISKIKSITDKATSPEQRTEICDELSEFIGRFITYNDRRKFEKYNLANPDVSTMSLDFQNNIIRYYTVLNYTIENLPSPSEMIK